MGSNTINRNFLQCIFYLAALFSITNTFPWASASPSTRNHVVTLKQSQTKMPLQCEVALTVPINNSEPGVKIRSLQGEKIVDESWFQRTNRGIHSDKSEHGLIAQKYKIERDPLTNHYPLEVLEPRFLRGKIVLDAGCGDGYFVEELREAGIEAYGLDIILKKFQKKKPYFFEASMEYTGLPKHSIDVIYSTFSVFSYRTKNSLRSNILLEMKRILKPGGKIRFSPVSREEINLLLRMHPELKMLEANSAFDSYVELQLVEK